MHAESHISHPYKVASDGLPVVAGLVGTWESKRRVLAPDWPERRQRERGDARKR